MSFLKTALPAFVLATAALTGCEKEATVRPPAPVLAEYLIAQPSNVTSGNAAIRFRVDSVTYDPATGGTAVARSSQTWTLAPVDSVDGGEQLFLITKRDSLRKLSGQQYWSWSLLDDDRGITNTIAGVTYLSLTSPFTVGSRWDVLAFTQASLVVTIEGEPLAVHKDWGAAVDSVGVYRLAGGQEVEAVWVSHADSENRIELRRVREIYGRGYGLLERHVEILDSQNLMDIPWSQKAERGFTVSMKRLF